MSVPDEGRQFVVIQSKSNESKQQKQKEKGTRTGQSQAVYKNICENTFIQVR